MTYKANNDKQTILKDILKNERGEYIRVTRIESQTGTVQYDIRNMYTNDNGEMCYTSKGIRIRSENIKDVLVAILSNLEADPYNEIMATLDAANSTDEGSQE